MIEKLEEWGCDTTGALGRMLDDEEFYSDCLKEVPADPCFEQLGQALAAHQIEQAFDAAHTLKGVLANLGLTPMYNIIVEIVEPLRAKSDAGLLDKYKELLKQKAHLEDILRQTR